MATWSRRHPATSPVVGDTNNVMTYTSSSFTPTEGELLVVCTDSTGSLATAPTMTASTNGILFVKLATQETNAAVVGRKIVWVADRLVPASPVAMTVTLTFASGDAATGANIFVHALTGMSKVGLDAVRQFVGPDSNVTGGTPASATLPAAPLTTNPLIAFLGNVTGSASAITAPSGFTDLGRQSYSTPTKGSYIFTRNSGATNATVTTGSNSTAGGFQVVEFDASTSSATLAAAGEASSTSALVGAAVAVLLAAGSVAGVTNATGDATRLGQTLPAAGTVAASSTVSGTATNRRPTSGTVAATSTVTGAPRAILAAAAQAGATTGVTGSVTALLRATGSTAATSTTSGSPSIIGGAATYPASGAVAATSAAQGSVRAKLAASGAATATTGATGATTSRLRATGVTAATTTLTGSPDAILGLAGTIDATSTVEGATTVIVAGPDTDFAGRILAANLTIPGATATLDTHEATITLDTLAATAVLDTATEATGTLTIPTATGVLT